MRARKGSVVVAGVFLVAAVVARAESPADASLAIRWEVVSDGVQGADGTTYYRPPVRLQLEVVGATQAPVRLEWSTDGAQWQPAGVVVSVPGSSVHLRATDAGGHAVATVASWHADVTSPRIALRLGDHEIVPGEKKFRVQEGDVLPLIVEDSESGVDTVRAYLGQEAVDYATQGGPWQPSPHGLRFSLKGTYVVQVEAKDRLGNVSQVMWKAVVKRASQRRGASVPVAPTPSPTPE